MKNKTISKLGFATFLIVVFYIFTVVYEGRINFSKESLQFAIDWSKLSKVVLSKDSSNLEIKKSEAGVWVLPQKNNFPASETMMRSLFLKLMDISTSERIQVSPSGIEKLGLNESGKASGHGVITLDYPESEAGKIFLGALRSRKGETMQKEMALTGEYVRFSLSDQVFILPMAINLQTDTKDWLAKEILSIKAEDVYEFQSFRKSAKSQELVESYTVVRIDKLFLKEGPTFVLKNPLASGEVVRPSTINEVAGSLDNLSLIDVESASSDKFKTIPIDGKAVYKLMNGQVLEIEYFKIAEKFFIKVSSSYDAALVTEISAKYEVFKADTKDLSNIRELPVIKESEVKSLNDEFSKWIYEINESVYSTFSKEKGDLIGVKGAPTNKDESAE